VASAVQPLMSIRILKRIIISGDGTDGTAPQQGHRTKILRSTTSVHDGMTRAPYHTLDTCVLSTGGRSCQSNPSNRPRQRRQVHEARQAERPRERRLLGPWPLPRRRVHYAYRYSELDATKSDEPASSLGVDSACATSTVVPATHHPLACMHCRSQCMSRAAKLLVL
jgi:hypothetical protein